MYINVFASQRIAEGFAENAFPYPRVRRCEKKSTSHVIPSEARNLHLFVFKETNADASLRSEFVTFWKFGGGAYVAPFFGGMYAPCRKGRRHAKLRHVCATRDQVQKSHKLSA
jgi:hypothetical protein